ncbi:MAG: cell division protein FtsZ [Candidatus Poribacteria bacterium]|nr:cell division protein FtsZ [Candidatus Poribacteria bacterium]
MIEFEQEEFENLRAKIKVIGVGGAGGNAVKRMIEAGITGIEFYAVNTDQQALLTCRGATQISIGVNTTEGLGSGANPEIGRKAAEEDREHLQTIVENANMVFITAGMGGGTGTGAAPLIASQAKELGALTIAVVTRPFNFEGQRRSTVAEEGLEELRQAADSVIVVPNQRLIDTMDRKLPIREAFRIGDEILLHGVKSISDIVTESGEINVDFADVESIMRGAGSALMGMGHATGDNRAPIAAEQAISSPLLEQTNIAGAVGMIVNITAPPDFMMHELDEAMQVIKDTAPEAQIIFGLVYKDELELDDEVLVTVIATGFDSDSAYALEGETSGRGSGNPAARYDDADVYQRQPSALSEQRMARAGRTRPGGRVSSGRPATPTRRLRPEAEQPVEQEQPPQDSGRKPARRRDQGAQQRDTDWEIPAFLRVQKRNRNDK